MASSSWGLSWGWGTTTVSSALPSAEGKELQAGGAGGGVPKFGAEPWRASQPSRLQQLRDAIPTTQGVREQLSKATIGVVSVFCLLEAGGTCYLGKGMLLLSGCNHPPPL